MPFAVRLFHLLFIACLPAAVILLLTGYPAAAIGVFVIGTPLFWYLRNQAVHSGMSATDAPAGLKRPDDIPVQLRVRSPYDASDADVRQALRLGILHPSANFAMVYETAFLPRLDVGEHVVGTDPMRFVFATSSANPGEPQFPTRDDGAWLLVTDVGLRWHFPEDGTPDYPGPSPREGPRDAKFGELQRVNVGRSFATMGQGPWGPARVHFLGLRQRGTGQDWTHIFGLSEGPETQRLLARLGLALGSASHSD